jgi:hypothetical protein
MFGESLQIFDSVVFQLPDDFDKDSSFLYLALTDTNCLGNEIVLDLNCSSIFFIKVSKTNLAFFSRNLC